MTIIIPMAGLSQRFTDAGFSLPKYMLYAGFKSVFNISVSSFKKYFNTLNFLFIARNVNDTKSFIETECKSMGLDHFQIVILENTTKGQAETVYLGIKLANLPENEEILIFNIDTIRKNYNLPEDMLKYDGFLEVFKGTGKNWSYVEPLNNKSQKVKRTAEKQEISDLCSTGLYFFKTQIDFCEAFTHNNKELKCELFVAPLYNYLINKNKNIYYHLIERDEVVFTGIPSEYLDLLKTIMLDI